VPAVGRSIAIASPLLDAWLDDGFRNRATQIYCRACACRGWFEDCVSPPRTRRFRDRHPGDAAARESLGSKRSRTRPNCYHNARSESFTTSAEKEQGVRLTDLEATRYFFGTQWNRGILILPVHQTGRAMTRPRPVAGQIRLRPGVRDGRWVSSVNAAQTDAIPVRGFTVPVTEAIPRPETWCRLSDVRSP